MPLFVLKEETESLDIDAIVLPSFKGVYRFYLTNTFNNKKLFHLLNTFSDEDKIQSLTKRENSLKSRLAKLIKINSSDELCVSKKCNDYNNRKYFKDRKKRLLVSIIQMIINKRIKRN